MFQDLLRKLSSEQGGRSFLFYATVKERIASQWRRLACILWLWNHAGYEVFWECDRTRSDSSMLATVLYELRDTRRYRHGLRTLR